LLEGSAINFYGKGITAKEVEDFYAKKSSQDPKIPYSYGLNSKLVRNDKGQLEEKVWKIKGMYGAAIEKIVYWLEKAKSVAENKKQDDVIGLFISFLLREIQRIKSEGDYEAAKIICGTNVELF
jgi:dipeptidyl-peptidase-3